MIPTILGYRPKNSVVCITFRGRRTAEAFRLDLPPERRANQRATVAAAIGMLSRIPGIDGVTFVIYTDETFAEKHGIPQYEFGNLLAERVHGSGFHLPDALCVAADGWAGYFDKAYPREGRPLSAIDDSELSHRTSHVEVLDDVADFALLPQPDPTVSARLEELLDGFTHRTAGSMGELDRLREMMDTDPASWSCTIAENPLAPLEVGAWMLYLAQRPSDRDVMAITVAFGCELGEEMMDRNAEFHRLQARSGETMDDVVRRAIAEGVVDPDDDEASYLLAGQGTRRPSRERVLGVIDLLRYLIAHTPDRYRVGPLCLVSWLSWSLGRGTAAGTFVDMALKINPSHSMATLLYSMYATGMLPEWAYSDGSLTS